MNDFLWGGLWEIRFWNTKKGIFKIQDFLILGF